MKLYFLVSEFIHRKDMPVPLPVVDAILEHHIAIMNPIRERLGFVIKVSQASGYRPPVYEQSKGRSVTGPHTFSDLKGAADYTCEKKFIKLLAEALIESGYTRIAYYPDQNFIHCDHRGSTVTLYRKRSSDRDWVKVTKEQFLRLFK